ncbi:MAG: hypothetical protein K2J99_16380 [Lachnospiraceae bacterium]|nr:hypothetical protein [Lachnospiraceae bacterium]
MSLAQMSFYGAVLTIVVMIVRALAINRLPKRTFIVLWSVVLIRLLVPFEITSSYSIYSFVGHEIGDKLSAGQPISLQQGAESTEVSGISEVKASPYAVKTADIGALTQLSEESGTEITNIVNKAEGKANSWIWTIIWGIGAALSGLFFTTTYVRCIREFRMSMPICNDYISQWVAKCGRHVNVRVSDRIDAPLTYGVLRPVILLPKKTEWEKTGQLEYVLWHEYMHIHYGDNVLKLVMVATLCIHWFNPFVWAVYFLLNRDVELACDESVVRRCGVSSKSTYANMLISMEAKRSGLVPLCNNFSQNAIEERVRAIMKIKKISLAAVIFAAGLVVGITTTFATSATEKTAQTAETGISDTGFTQEEYDKLMALKFEDYEAMTVAEFQEKVWKLTDTVEYRELLERFSQSTSFYEKQDVDDRASFMFNVLDPLTAENWQRRDFGGYVSAGGSNPEESVVQDMATLEYVVTLTILDADKLTVGEYIAARSGMSDSIEQIFTTGYTAGEMADEEYMHTAIDSTMSELAEAFGTDALKLDVEYVYQPLDSLIEYINDAYVDEEFKEEVREQWDALLKPYTPFGLTYEYDARTYECRMLFQGKDVRGIMDEYQNTWITAHAGIGYAEDAIEVYAVYEDGQLTGLRAATAEEQEEWTLRRKETTGSRYNSNEEVREFLAGTQEDYQSILSLKKSDYEQMSLADFNSALLEWGNEHYDSYDRINCDVIWDDFRVNLSGEDKEFIVRTVSLSGNENAMAVRSSYTGRPEEDVSLGYDLTKTPEGDEAQYVWCRMYCQFSYHVSDKEKVTVGERDRSVGGMSAGIQEFWEQTDIEDILKMDKGDIIKKLNELAEEHSTENITITIGAEDQIGFERMDERSLMQEK